METALCVVWLLLNMGLNLYNKWMFSVLHLHIPLLIVGCQQLMTLGVLQGMYYARHKHMTWAISWDDYTTVLGLAALFGLNTMCNIVSMVHLSLTLNQCIRSFLPVATMCTAMSIEGKTFPPWQWLNAVGICVGVVFAVYDNPSGNVFGVVMCAISVGASAAQNSYAATLLRDKLEPYELTLLQAPPLAVVAFLCSFMYESDAFDDLQHTSMTEVVGLIVLSGVLAVSYNVCRFLVVQHTSSVFLSILGNFKVALMILLDHVCFGTMFGLVNSLGVLLTVVCFTLHGLMKTWNTYTALETDEDMAVYRDDPPTTQ